MWRQQASASLVARPFSGMACGEKRIHGMSYIAWLGIDYQRRDGQETWHDSQLGFLVNSGYRDAGYLIRRQENGNEANL
jgi:hypothetical protein